VNGCQLQNQKLLGKVDKSKVNKKNKSYPKLKKMTRINQLRRRKKIIKHKNIKK
jgi:hypothetical protein